MFTEWFTQTNTYSHRQHHMVLLPEYQQCYQAEEDALLWWIVAGNNMWCHHFQAKAKAESRHCEHSSSTCTRKFKSKPSAGKVILIVVFTISGLFMLVFKNPNITISPHHYHWTQSFTPPSKSVLACSVMLTRSAVMLHNRRPTLFSIHYCP